MSSTSTLSAVELALNKLPNVQVSSHPVLHHKLTLLRRNETKAATFRALLAELTFYLGYEATASFTVDQRMVTTPIGECSGFRLHDRLTIIPVMRAGMGMLDSMLKLIPRAAVHHLGLYHKRDHELPVLYYNKLPVSEAAELFCLLRTFSPLPPSFRPLSMFGPSILPFNTSCTDWYARRCMPTATPQWCWNQLSRQR